MDAGGVCYTSYYGEITIRRKSENIAFAKARDIEEEAILMQKQKILDKDRIATGKKSFITLSGQPQDGASQFISAYPESEFVVRTEDWEGTVNGEFRKGTGIRRLELVKGAFSVYPASAEVEIPLVKIEGSGNGREQALHYIVDVLPDMTVILPGCRLLVSPKGGRSYETAPAFGSIGMTELLVTRNGMFEKKIQVDERASTLASYAIFFLSGMGTLMHDEEYRNASARKIEENRKKSEEYLKQMPTEVDLEKMKGTGKMNETQLEMARAMSKAAKASGGSDPMAAMNMFANLDFSKLKDMPGLTPEQRKQIERGMPLVAKMQKEFNESRQAQKLDARMKLSAKYMATAASDPVAKKTLAKVNKELQDKLDAYALPDYPQPKEWARVK